MIIKGIVPSKILASLGNETIQCELIFGDGSKSTASVPAGLSAGQFEVRKSTPDEAIGEIEKYSAELLNVDWDQKSLDDKLTSLNIGGNSSLAISTAFWKATHPDLHGSTKFPKLMTLLFEGGKHGNGGISMQEFMMIEESVSQADADFKKMRDFLASKGVETTVGAEGAFSPQSYTNVLALETIMSVFPQAHIALDAAGSFKVGAVGYDDLLKKYPIVSIEDPFSDEEWEKWAEFYQKFGDKIMVVGDDLTVTNSQRVTESCEKKTINAVIIKPNQNGTISGALLAVETAKKYGLKIIVSHRGEETDDDWIADFAVFVEADYVKFGGMDRGERIAKYNRLRALGMK